MIYKVKVITRASRNKVVDEGDNNLKVYLRVVPEKGKANQELIEMLSSYFNVSKSKIILISGEKSHHKKIEVL